MSFINECCSILRRSNKDMLYIYLDKDGLYYNYYDSNNRIINRDRLVNDKNLDFTKYSFTLDKKDNIYCIYSDKYLQILECKNGSTVFTQKECITYNYKKFGLVFPHIQYINDNTHVFYYAFNNNSSNTCVLFHHYKEDDYWVENKIDFVNHLVLNDYIILWNKSVPTIFYFNLVNGCEEIFASRFNLGTFAWSTPIQITNSGENKIYLSGIRDSINFYHLSFCENIKNGYSVKYINGYLNDNKFELNNSSYLSKPSTCMYPSIVKNENKLLISWVDFNKLFTSSSENLGKSWDEPHLDNDSIEEKFSRCSFYSNYKGDLSYNVNEVFSTINDVGILGI